MKSKEGKKALKDSKQIVYFFFIQSNILFSLVNNENKRTNENVQKFFWVTNFFLKIVTVMNFCFLLLIFKSFELNVNDNFNLFVLFDNFQ